jgi:ligand-binding sensor domain-containing protein
MHYSLKRKIGLFTTMCFFISSFIVKGQTFSFKNFGTESRLPDTYIYTLNQDDNGFLWIGTGGGLVRFDGFDFLPVTFPDSITNRYVSASLKDHIGRLWFGCDDGSLFYAQGNELVKTRELNVQNINQILEGDDGFIYLIPQSRMLLKLNPEKPEEIQRLFVDRDIFMTSACFVKNGDLLLGTQESLLYCTIAGDSVKTGSVVPGIEYSKVQLIKSTDQPGIFLIGTEGSGLFRLSILNDQPVLSRFRNHPEFESLDIKTISKDADGNYWIATFGEGAYQVRFSAGIDSINIQNKYNISTGLQGQNVRIIFQDMENNIWIGMYGEGLSMLNSYAFSFYSLSDNPVRNDIIYVRELKGYYFLGTPGGYYLFNKNTGKAEHYYDLSSYVGNSEIAAFFYEDENDLWIGTRGNGLYHKTRYGNVRLFYRSGSTGEDYISDISSDGKNIWLSTINGVVVLSKRDGSLLKTYTIEDGLSHNSINQVLIKSDGTALVATECDRLYDIDLQKTKKGISVGNNIMYGSTKNKVLCYMESKNGEIWAGTAGNGAFYFKGDTVIELTRDKGLFSNYCYSIFSDSENDTWIGHERGFSRYDQKTGIINVFTTDFAKGGDCNPKAITESSDGMILIGTTEGLIIYDRQKDRQKSVPPVNNIISVNINNVDYPLQKVYSLPYNKYTVKINYVGINLRDPDKVYYTTKLDNFDNAWMDMRLTRQVTYPLRDGRYRFNLMSVNEEGLSSNKTLYFDLFIKKPFWRTWWFILIGVLIVAVILITIILEREKAQKRLNEYLESELAERTRQVLKQKDEIELQNIEITDSINYAKRIQSSILPEIHKLKETFRDAFIFFNPRDIVSGDFYWFDKIDTDRFIVVCADSTGHGVPGAFMSMIGSTLLQDIISRKGITRPSKILSLLDEQIFSTLNQNVDVGVSNDGMDMVICEFDLKSKHFRFASAMRPVIVMMGGESYYIK